MPEEMMTRTTDSSAVAMGETGGLGNAVSDFIQNAAGSDDNSQWAISEQAGQDADQFDEYYLALPYSYMMSDHRSARCL